jgi:HK97 family phage portal protein
MIIKILGKELFEISRKSTISWSMGEALRWLYADRTEGEITIGTAYKQHPWVYICIGKIARSLSQIPFKIYKKGSDVEIKSGEVVELFRTGWRYLNRFSAWEGTTVWKQMTGNAFWHIEKAGKMVVQITLLDARRMVPRMDGDVLVGWKYAGQINYLPDEIIQFKFFNPYNSVTGLSPLQAAINSVQGDDYATRFNKGILKNGSFPGSVIEVERNLQDAQVARIKKDFESIHKGPDKAGKVAILEGGAKYKELRITPAELQFIEQRKMSKDEIHGVYGVPLAMTGDTSSFNRANMRDIKKEFYTKTIMPELTSYEETLNNEFFARYYRDFDCEFDITEIVELQEEFAEKIVMAKDLFAMGFTGNEINDMLMLGFKDKPWRNYWWIPFGMAPAEEAPEEEPEEPEEPEPEENVEAMINKLEKFAGIKDNKKDYVIWKGLINRIYPLEKEYRKKLSRYMFEVRQDILEAYFSKYGKGIKGVKAEKNDLFNVGDAKKKLQKISEPFILDSIKKGGQLVFDEINLDDQFELVNQDAVRFFNNQVMYLDEIPDTIDKQTIAIMTEATKEGWSVEQTVKKLRDMMDFATNRSKVIARTELMSSANGGRFLAYEDAEIEKHYWIDSFDDRVRDQHRLHGEIVEVGKEFSNGLKYPGDRTGSGSTPENIISCRCTTGSILK